MKDKARKPTTTPGSEPPAMEVLASSWAGTWLSRETASSASPRRSRRTISVFRCTLHRSGSSAGDAGPEDAE
jgi:hypothetical protein